MILYLKVVIAIAVIIAIGLLSGIRFILTREVMRCRFCGYQSSIEEFEHSSTLFECPSCGSRWPIRN